jgi:hypothetical protein
VICGTTHKTVRRVIVAHEAGARALARRDRGHNNDGVRALVDERVRASAGRISAKRLLPAARAAGYGGSARNFRRLVAEVKAAWRPGHHRGRRPAVWTPGDTLAIDWVHRAACTCSARCWLGLGCGSCGPQRTRSPRRRCGCWPSASRCWAGCPRRCWLTGWAA